MDITLGERRIMTKRLIWIALGFLVIVLAACGGATADTAEIAPDTNIDISQLGPNIDVETVAAIKDRDDVLVLDVREQWEYDEGHIAGVELIPMNEIPVRLDEIPTDKEVVVTCRSGNRSGQVTQYLQEQGFTNVHNMQGGILAWESAGFAVER